MDLSGNEFNSDIYFGIGRFQNLTVLNLRKNSFTGVLPSSIARLTNLQEFDVSLNFKLGGPIFEFCSRWSKLKYFDISETLASGTIPSALGLLTDLKMLRLLDVAMWGTVPSEIGLLEPLGTYAQRLTALPFCLLVTQNSTIFNIFSSTATLRLGKSSLHGSLPGEIGMLSNLEMFEIVESNLSGTIPTSVGLWSKK